MNKPGVPGAAVNEPSSAPPLLKSRLRSRLADWVAALSLAHLCLISVWFPMLYDSDKGYFNKVPVAAPSMLAFLVNMTGLALLIWLPLHARRRYKGIPLQIVLALLFILLLISPLDFIRSQVLHIAPDRLYTVLKHPAGLACALLLLAGVAWRPRAVARGVYYVINLLCPFVAFTVLRIALLLAGVQHLAQYNGHPALAPALPARAEAPRVIWIIFDAMDQRCVLEMPPHGYSFPELDHFRSQAISSTNAHSPGSVTFLSLASLLTGNLLSSGRIANDSDLKVILPGSGREVLWSSLPSVFDSVRELGINSAVVGWYHPYDRLVGRAVSACSWYPLPLFEPARASTFRASLTREFGTITGLFHRRALFAKLCQEALADALAVGTNSAYGLCFLHLPPPHTPGIYLPQQDRFTIRGMGEVAGYFNNAALADRFLGKLRRSLESNGQWDKTWVIISADHGWSGATHYGGSVDARVPFLVKSPGTNSPVLSPTRFNTVGTRDFLLAIFRGELKNQSDALQWLRSHPSDLEQVLDAGPK